VTLALKVTEAPRLVLDIVLPGPQRLQEKGLLVGETETLGVGAAVIVGAAVGGAEDENFEGALDTDGTLEGRIDLVGAGVGGGVGERVGASVFWEVSTAYQIRYPKAPAAKRFRITNMMIERGVKLHFTGSPLSLYSTSPFSGSSAKKSPLSLSAAGSPVISGPGGSYAGGSSDDMLFQSSDAVE